MQGRRTTKNRLRGVLSLLLVCLIMATMVSWQGLPMAERTVSADSSGTGATELSDELLDQLWENKVTNSTSTGLGWCDTSYSPLDAMWHKTYDGTSVTVTAVTSDNIAAKLSNAVGQRLDGTVSYTSVETTEEKYIYGGADTSSPYMPLLYDTVVNDTELPLYYTLETDYALNSNGSASVYRKYYVSTANQLAVLLYNYQKNVASIKATTAEGKLVGASLIASKVGIVLLNDIDLGGSTGVQWVGYYNNNTVLDIDGQGYTIYNGYFTTSVYKFLGNSKSENGDQKFSIRNVTFSNMFLSRAGGIFGTKVKNAYFDNVNFVNCLAVAADTSSVTIVLGLDYQNCYLKNCTAEKSYVRASGHAAIFASYNGNCGLDASTAYNRSYLGDTSDDSSLGDISDDSSIESWYYTSIPDDIGEIERAWNGSTSQSKEYSGKKLASTFPSIYEGCAVVNSEVYDSGTHSGTFVSCGRSYLIFRNCFTNSTIYGSSRTGVFIGASIGCSAGFYYNVDGKKTFTNMVFENCYSSGTVEGNRLIGGFVGTVFNDSISTGKNRPKSAKYYGKVVFFNCYSTSSVGMKYAGNTGIGGFVGDVWGNSQNAEVDTNEQQHLFQNCYAAGEVGSILICTDTEPKSDGNTINANNAVGGFMGTYNTNYAVPELINCYYDKQTTAMRERDIGCALTWTNYDKSKLTDEQLCNSLYQEDENTLTGVYTLKSNSKSYQVDGLADNVRFDEKYDGWTYSYGYYPRLKTVEEKNEGVTDSYTEGDLVGKMKYERALLYYNCSLASTATVFLDHYDEVLQSDGETSDEVDEIEYIYDTVRDITSKFTFTSSCDTDITWNTDTEKNESSSFPDQMYGKTEDGEQGEGFTIAYGNYSETYCPDVVNVQNIKGTYTCVDFAPGKQWVQVKVGESTGLTGTRRLRLLPMAYLNAGNLIHVNVIAKSDTAEDSSNDTESDVTASAADADETETTENTDTATNWANKITLTKSDGETISLSSFNHGYGVVYAITERARELGTNYDNQKIIDYQTATSGGDYFALYGTYLLSDTPSTSVGLDSETSTMYAQKFEVTGDNNESASDGMTMVRVFKAEVNTETKSLERTEEVDLSDGSTERSKWEGKTLFDKDDVGYYYMVYYWKLDDGRYLEDSKVVYISAASYHVEAVTGLLNEKHTVAETVATDITNTDETSTYMLYSPVDQYISEAGTVDSLSKVYRSAQEGFSEDTAASYYTNYTPEYSYNNDVKFNDGDTYYVKSTYIETSSNQTVVGWHREKNYVMTGLIIEARGDESEAWQEVARIDKDVVSSEDITRDEEDITRDYFDNAKYSYTLTSYTIKQDKETQLYDVTTTNQEVTFSVQSYNTNSDSLDQYITLEYEVNEGEGATLTELHDDLRVTVLLRNETADVTGEKTVLLELDDVTDDWSTDETYVSSTSAKSLRYGEAAKQVDDAALAADSDSRKAVLSGDTLTYRLRLQNQGFYTADNLVVTDTVPEGCTYVDGSMRIYRQYKNITGGTKSGQVEYGSLKRMDNSSEAGYTVTYDADSGTLTWIIPEVKLSYDYYVEFRVIVDDIGAANLSKTLKNTATWNYDYSSQSENTDLTLTHNDDYTSYTLTFKNANTDATAATVTSLINNYADGFTPQRYGIVTKMDSSGTVTAKWLVPFDSTETNATIGTGSAAYNVYGISGDDALLNQVNSMGETEVASKYQAATTLTQADFTLNPGESLVLYLQGTQSAVTADSPISNTGTVNYTWQSSSESNTTLASSATVAQKQSNTVETDVTWLYLDITKQIAQADAEQSFLMKIEYYPDETATIPTETFYTRLTCDTPVTDEEGAATYTGSQLVQCGKRGIYRVTELDDWSSTDYTLESVSYKEDSTAEVESLEDSAVSISLPGASTSLSSGAFLTIAGTDPLNHAPEAIFRNTAGSYAYLSSQAYAENTFQKASGGDGE